MENDIINLLLNHGTVSGRTSKPILYHTVKTVHSIHVGQKFEDYQAFDSAIERYQSAKSVQFYKRDSRDRSNTVSDSVDSPVAKGRKHVFMESWKTTRPWLQVDSKNKMYCYWCVTSKKSNAFTIGCTNFRTSTLDRHVALPSHKEAMHDITLRANMESASKTFQQKN